MPPLLHSPLPRDNSTEENFVTVAPFCLSSTNQHLSYIFGAIFSLISNKMMSTKIYKKKKEETFRRRRGDIKANKMCIHRTEKRASNNENDFRCRQILHIFVCDCIFFGLKSRPEQFEPFVFCFRLTRIFFLFPLFRFADSDQKIKTGSALHRSHNGWLLEIIGSGKSCAQLWTATSCTCACTWTIAAGNANGIVNTIWIATWS